MTVAIGLVCSDGVLVAADSMASEQMIAQRGVKVHTLEKAPVVWTMAGSVYVSEEVEQALLTLDNEGSPTGLLSYLTQPNLMTVRSQLQPMINKKMRECYQTALHNPENMRATFLVLGYANETPWFLEFADDGQVNWHTADRFYAVGSGGAFAQVARGLMSHYFATGLTLEQGKRLAYRTIEATCEVSSGFVGLPVQMAVCDESGPRTLSSDELNELGLAVAGWKELEAETLRMGPKEAAEVAKHDLPAIGSPPIPPVSVEPTGEG